MEVGALTAYLSYLMQIVMSVMMATFMMMMIPRSAVCADRITEVLDTETSVVPPSRAGHRAARARAPPARPGRPSPTRAPTRRCCASVDLEARPGQTVAIIGSTGAGKSTLVNLVPRLFDATGGRVLVGGVDVRDIEPGGALVAARAGAAEGVPLHRHRSPTTCATASPTPPRRRCGRRSRSPRRATSSRRMPDGLDARIAQGGTNLSGGQRQRLAIARAVVRRPGDLPLRRLASRRSTSPPTPGCAPRCGR